MRNEFLPFVISFTSVYKVVRIVLAVIHIAQSATQVLKIGDAQNFLGDLKGIVVDLGKVLPLFRLIVVLFPKLRKFNQFLHRKLVKNALHRIEQDIREACLQIVNDRKLISKNGSHFPHMVCMATKRVVNGPQVVVICSVHVTNKTTHVKRIQRMDEVGRNTGLFACNVPILLISR